MASPDTDMRALLRGRLQQIVETQGHRSDRLAPQGIPVLSRAPILLALEQLRIARKEHERGVDVDYRALLRAQAVEEAGAEGVHLRQLLPLRLACLRLRRFPAPGSTPTPLNLDPPEEVQDMLKKCSDGEAASRRSDRKMLAG